jgi:hypothetical protein
LPETGLSTGRTLVETGHLQVRRARAAEFSEADMEAALARLPDAPAIA